MGFGGIRMMSFMWWLDGVVEEFLIGRLHVVVQVRNFVQLCVDGYYNGTIFHRLIKTFMVQGGDPTGTGTGEWVMNDMRSKLWHFLDGSSDYLLLMSWWLWLCGKFGQVEIPSMGGRSLMRFIPVCDSITEVWLRVPMRELPIAITVSSSSPLTAAIGLTRRIQYLER